MPLPKGAASCSVGVRLSHSSWEMRQISMIGIAGINSALRRFWRKGRLPPAFAIWMRTSGLTSGKMRRQIPGRLRLPRLLPWPVLMTSTGMGLGKVSQITVGSGPRASLVLAGLPTVWGIGDGMARGAGPGSLMSRGVGFPTTTGAGPGIRTAGSGFPVATLGSAGGGGGGGNGRRTMSPSLDGVIAMHGAIGMGSGMATAGAIAMGVVGSDGARWLLESPSPLPPLLLRVRLRSCATRLCPEGSVDWRVAASPRGVSSRSPVLSRFHPEAKLAVGEGISSPRSSMRGRSDRIRGALPLEPLSWSGERWLDA